MSDFTRYFISRRTGKAEPHSAGLLYRRKDVDPVVDALRARIRELEAEVARLSDTAQGVEVKPLDLSNLLKHAFISGRNSVEGCDDFVNCFEKAVAAWTEYDPTPCKAYDRILSALTPAPVTVGEAAREEIVDTTACFPAALTTDRRYAENIVGWLERHHPAALRALSGEGE